MDHNAAWLWKGENIEKQSDGKFRTTKYRKDLNRAIALVAKSGKLILTQNNTNMEFIVDPYFYSAQLGTEIMKDVWKVMAMSDDEKFISTILDNSPSPLVTMEYDDLCDYAVEVLKWLN